jgi:hypothetical protein
MLPGVAWATIARIAADRGGERCIVSHHAAAELPARQVLFD